MTGRQYAFRWWQHRKWKLQWMDKIHLSADLITQAFGDAMAERKVDGI